MKKSLLTSGVISYLVLITFGCAKENKQDEIRANLTKTETLLLKSYAIAKENDDLLILHVGANGEFTDPDLMMEDSLYHLNDSICNQYYLVYCKDMMDGDNMMGGNMMGGNTMHGSSMMAIHTFMGDTAKVNQCYRNLLNIRTGHTNHHPKN